MKSYVFVKSLAQVNIEKLHSGMGYPWHTMVCERDGWTDDQKKANPWKGFNADISKSIPSIELDWAGNESMEALLNDLRKEHVEIFFCENTVANAGIDAVIVAKIGKLWCGGTPIIVYAGKKAALPENEEPEYVINPAYAHMTMPQIKQAEIAYDNLHNEGREGYSPYRDNLWLEVG